MEIRRTSILIKNALFVQTPSSGSFFRKLSREVVTPRTSSECFGRVAEIHNVEGNRQKGRLRIG